MRILLTSSLIFLSFIVLLAGCQTKTKETGETTDFSKLASCLTEKGWVMYGRELSEETREQKQLFGKSFASINFVDCDLELETCFDTQNIKKYPTWIGPKEKRIEGVLSLEKLKQETECG